MLLTSLIKDDLILAMEQTKIKLSVIQGDFKTQVDATTIANAIYVEDSNELEQARKNY